MEVFEAIYRRRAVREYRPDPVGEEVIRKILDAANWAPSAMNLQQWEFLVVSGKKLAEMGKNYAKIIEWFTCDWKPGEVRGSMKREDFIRFAATYGNAPLVIVVLTDGHAQPNYAKANLESASAAMENMLLAATALGLGTCWMTGPLYDEKYLRMLLAIPDSREIVAVTPIGYPEKIPEPPARLDPGLEKNVRWVN